MEQVLFQKDRTPAHFTLTGCVFLNKAFQCCWICCGSPYNADVTTPGNSLQGIIKASSSMLLQHSENYKPLLQMPAPPLTPEMVHMMSHTMW